MACDRNDGFGPGPEPGERDRNAPFEGCGRLDGHVACGLWSDWSRIPAPYGCSPVHTPAPTPGHDRLEPSASASCCTVVAAEGMHHVSGFENTSLIGLGVGLLASGILACGPSGSLEEDPVGRKPNIILIMADDLGAETLGCYGNTAYSTPRLDRMAHEGARFENAFSTPVCSPTRAMILTGLHPNRTGILERLDSPADSDKRNRLPVHLETFAQALQATGYATAIAGKWHLGDFQSFPDQPKSHGFDEHCLWVQYWDGERRSRYYGPHNWENGKYRIHGEETFGPDYYSDFLLGFIERNKDRPFLAYFPMNLVHGPLVSPPNLGTFSEGKYPYDLGKSEKMIGHMITYMDDIVGRFLDKLKELSLDDDTLVLFTGDNGSATNLESRLGEFRIRGGKRTMNEAGTRVPFLARWPGRIPPGRRDAFFSLLDMKPTLLSIAGIEGGGPVDGMDLSHNLLGMPGVDREHFYMAFEGDVYFVRGKRFRLHEDGRMYDVPVSSDQARYGMAVLPAASDRPEARRLLQGHLNSFMRIQKTDDSYGIIPFGTGGDRFKNAQDAVAR